MCTVTYAPFLVTQKGCDKSQSATKHAICNAHDAMYIGYDSPRKWFAFLLGDVRP